MANILKSIDKGVLRDASGQNHTAKYLTLLLTVISCGVFLLVAMGKAPVSLLFTFILPIIGWATMASKSKNNYLP